MIDSQFLIAIVITIVVTIIIILLWSTSKKPPPHKNDTFFKDSRYSLHNDDICRHLQILISHAGYEDEVFIENDLEKYYDKICKDYKKDSDGYPDYNRDVCQQIRPMIDKTAVYDMSVEIDLHDDLEKYFNENCKVDRYNLEAQ